MNSGTVHLVATDPPFNKSRDFHATPDSLAAGAQFTDRWSWEKDVHEEWVDNIKDDWPGVWKVIEAARVTSGKDMAAFLCWLGVRLMAMHRVLRNDRSIYLHCDPTASHYLKAIMDAIFGGKNFVNEIIWCYKSGGASKKHWAKKHDIILFYEKQRNHKKFHIERNEKSYMGKNYSTGNKKVKLYKDELVEYLGPHTLVYPKDWWDGIGMISTAAKHSSDRRTGYPTQKPLALYERIIKASSNEGDFVLDPFTGCATTCVAAERLGRKWVGIDIWDGAKDVVLDRIEKEGLAVSGSKIGGESGGTRTLAFGDITYSTVPPVRTDDNEVAAPNLKLKVKRPVKPWEKMSHKQIFNVLAKAQNAGNSGFVICAGCGRELEKEFMQLDHIAPKVGRGKNNISNRILLCAPCNIRKGSDLNLYGLAKSNKSKDVNWMKNEKLALWAQEEATERAEWVEYNFDTDECKALMQED